MSQEDIKKLVSLQRNHFKSGTTKPYQNRIALLRKLKEVILSNKDKIYGALKKDLNKCEFEAYVSETGLLIKDIDFVVKKLKRWMRPNRIKTPLIHFPAKSYIYHEPYGTILIIAPWNYPLQLLISPLIGALSAGNTAIIKPSEIARNTSHVVAEIIGKHFDPEVVSVVEGSVQETTHLLNEHFDYIFYTGSAKVGKIVMENAARHLTPITLELGGKSPCLIFGDVDLDLAAKRIVWGKFFNNGQTCVSPDYVIIQKGFKI